MVGAGEPLPDLYFYRSPSWGAAGKNKRAKKEKGGGIRFEEAVGNGFQGRILYKPQSPPNKYYHNPIKKAISIFTFFDIFILYFRAAVAELWQGGVPRHHRGNLSVIPVDSGEATGPMLHSISLVPPRPLNGLRTLQKIHDFYIDFFISIVYDMIANYGEPKRF